MTQLLIESLRKPLTMRPLTTLTANLSASLVLGLGLGGCDRLPDEDFEHYFDRIFETSKTPATNNIPSPSHPRADSNQHNSSAIPVMTQTTIDCGATHFTTSNLWIYSRTLASVQFHMVGQRDRPVYFQPKIRRSLGLNPGEYLPGVSISVFAEHENYSHPFGKIDITYPTDEEGKMFLERCGVLAVRNSQGGIIRYISLDDMYEQMRNTLPTFLSWRGSHSITVSNF